MTISIKTKLHKSTNPELKLLINPAIWNTRCIIWTYSYFKISL